MTKTYSVAEGVSWVNGKPVPENRELRLSKREAQFDLDQGRIVEKVEVVAVPSDNRAPSTAVLRAEETVASAENRKRGR